MLRNVFLSKTRDIIRSELAPNDTSCIHGVACSEDKGGSSATLKYRGLRTRLKVLRFDLEESAAATTATVVASTKVLRSCCGAYLSFLIDLSISEHFSLFLTVPPRNLQANDGNYTKLRCRGSSMDQTDFYNLVILTLPQTSIIGAILGK